MPTGVQHLSCKWEMANTDNSYSDMQVLYIGSSSSRLLQTMPAIRCHIVLRLDLPQVIAIRITGQPIAYKMAENVVRN